MIRHSLRRGASSMATIALIIGGVAVLGLGVVVGKQLGEGPDITVIEAANDEVPSAADSTAEPPAQRLPETMPPSREAVAPPTIGPRAAAPGTDPVTATWNNGVPPVTFDPPVIDHGFVEPHVTKKAVVKIVNPTDEPLRIITTKPSCKCTAAELNNVTLAPGESVDLPTSFEVGGHLHKRSAKVRVFVEGWQTPAEIEITATVGLPVYAEPSYISAVYDQATGMRQASGEFVVKSRDGRPFNILGVDGVAPEFVGFDPAVDEPRNEYTLRWDISELDQQTCRLPDGRPLRPFWAVETDHPACPIFDMQVRHECTLPEPREGGRHWFPDTRRLLLGELQPGESVEATVRLRWPRMDADEELKHVSTDSPYLTAEVVDYRPDGVDERVATIRFTLKETHPGGLIYAHAFLHATRTSAPLFLVLRGDR